MKAALSLTILAISWLVQSATAQTTTAVVFSEMGEKFTLYLNGQPMNDAPASRIEMDALTLEFYQARVDFEENALADFSHKTFGVQQGVQNVYVIKKNRKGRYVLRYAGGAAGAPTPTPADEWNSQPPPVPASSTVGGSTTVTTTSSNGQSTTTVKETTTTRADGERVSIEMSVDGVSMDVQMEVPESRVETASQSRMTVTEEHAYGTETLAGCEVSPSEFRTIQSSIASKDFDDTKLSTAKQVAQAKCLNSAQVRDIMGLLDFESSRLEFAKLAHEQVVDPENYYLVNDGFEFELSIEELQEFINQ